MERVKLEVLGLSYSQTQAGAYALILSVEDSEQRIPIIIGGFEAQSIAIQLEGLTPPRPLTHDLFHQFAVSYNIDLKEVFIYKLEEGVFYSSLTFNDGKETRIVDARTSDSVALALRFNVPIFTTMDIVKKAGIIISLSKDGDESNEVKTNPQKQKSQKTLSELSIVDLEKLMQEAINNEDYEKASKIRDEINRKSK
jgi:uncharacterized protein